MNKNLPNKWIRKAIKDKIHNIKVDKKTIPCYDMNVTGSKQPKYYTLLKGQDNTVDKANKCEWYWDSSVSIEVVVTFQKTGNTGSRLLADNIADQVRALTNNLVLDAASGLTIFTQTISFPVDLELKTDNQVVFRKLIQLDFRIE